MPASIHQGWMSLVQGILICSVSYAGFAQQPRSPQMPAPPPMRFVSRDERSQLNESRDPKARMRLTLEIAEAHLKNAEDFTSHRDFDHASEELGRYLGLLEDARAFLSTMNSSKNSSRDLFRHFDISLRSLVPRLAVMRRDTPADYAGHIKAAEEYTRQIRSEILDNFYGHTVLRESADPKKPDELKDLPEENKRP